MKPSGQLGKTENPQKTVQLWIHWLKELVEGTESWEEQKKSNLEKTKESFNKDTEDLKLHDKLVQVKEE